MDLPTRLRVELERAEMSIREASRVAERSKGWVQSILSGASKHPAGDALDRLAAALGISTEYLLSGRLPRERGTSAAVDALESESRDGFEKAFASEWWEGMRAPSPLEAKTIGEEARATRAREGTWGLPPAIWREDFRARLQAMRRPEKQVWPDEGTLRRWAHRPVRGIRKVRLTDDPRRVVLDAENADLA